MNIKLKLDGTKFLLAMLIFFFPMIVFWLFGRPLYVWLEMLLIILCMMKYKKLYPINFNIINCIYLSIILSAISALMGDLPSNQQKSAIIQTLYAVITYLAISYVFHFVRLKAIDTLSTIIKAFKVMLLVELFWIPLQYICYHAFSLDINNLIFVDTLHMVENASFVRSWIWYPSGLSWHSALLAPMFVVGLFIFDKLWIRGLIVIDALICGNSTTAIGTIIAVILLFFRFLRREKKLKIKSLINTIIILIICGITAYRIGMFEKIQNQVLYTYARIFSVESDASTLAHLGYFTDYFEIVKESSPFQVLFGYGEGCSGYPIWLLNRRQTSLQSWSVECDLIDLLLSRGLFGFIIFYLFLLYIAFNGYKIDKRYTLVIFVVIIEGFGYNVQWPYMVFIEMIFFLCINKKISFFDIAIQDKLFTRRRKTNEFQSINNSCNIQSSME